MSENYWPVPYSTNVTIGMNYDNNIIEELYDAVYANFVEEIDAVDNGIADRDGRARY